MRAGWHMRVKVEILPWLSTMMKPRVTGRLAFDHDLAGSSFRDLLRELAKADPDFERVVFDSQGGEMRYPALAIMNDKLLEFLNGLETPLSEGDSVVFMAAYTGG